MKFDQLLGNWKIVNIGEIADVKGGKRLPKGHKLLESHTSHPYIRVLDFKKRTVNFENIKFLSEETFESIKNYRISSDDVYISIAGTIGLAGTIPPSLNGPNLTENAAKLCNLKNIDKKFLVYVLDSNFVKSQIKALTMAVTQPKLALFRIKNLKIPLPPLKTQKKIVEILEKAEQLKEWRVESDELAEKYLEGFFINFFGNVIDNPKEWEEKSIEELCSEIVDCPHSTPKYVDYKTEFPCIRTTELKNGYIDWKEMKYLDEDGYSKRIKRLKPITGDIVYGGEGSFGEAARVPRDTNICLGQRVMLFRPNESCNSTFLWALLRSEGIYSQAVRKTSGSTVGHVNIKDIKRFKAFCPPLELQNQFANIVTQFEEIKNYQSQSKQQIDNLFNTLMQKAFKGELVC